MHSDSKKHRSFLYLLFGVNDAMSSLYKNDLLILQKNSNRIISESHLASFFGRTGMGLSS
jgi:hypothetical protein